MVISLASLAYKACACDTVIPPPANLWEAQCVYVADKDTKSVIIYANDLYLHFIQANFPEIKTLADLIGKDD
ncbi:MAG: hypothetical protein NT154_29765 [Verrucomicrobia bacterium]|nr:hypothetical protein [Verrucomicrobiota bacterium]